VSTEAKTDLVRYQDENQISRQGTRYKAQVEELRITSRDSYLQMVALVKISKSYQQAVKDFFERLRQKTFDAYQEVLKQLHDYSKPFQDAETIGKQRMRDWEDLEEKKRREQEAAAAEKREAAAAEARKNGKEAKAERIETALPVARENRAHVEGVQYVDNWKGRLPGVPGSEGWLASLRELLKAVLAGKAPIGFVALNESEVNRFAKATSGKMPISGIEWVNDKTVKVGR
jgi:hypothetical protein